MVGGIGEGEGGGEGEFGGHCCGGRSGVVVSFCRGATLVCCLEFGGEGLVVGGEMA